MQSTQVKVEELGATRRRLDVEIPESAVAAEMDRAFSRVQKQARIKGFRQGKVPRAVLERHFGDQVRADVLSHLIEHSYSDALNQSDLRPVGPPEIVPESLEKGLPLRYSATVDIWPQVEIQDYHGLPVRRPVRKVTDEDVDRALEQLRESLAQLRPIEERDVAATGDFANFDYEASVDGSPLGEGKQENRLVEIGAGQVAPEVDDGFVGMSVGETKTLEVSFPEDHPDPSVAGKQATFVVTLRGIREKIVPPADDDLAKEHGECETLAGLREHLRERIQQSHETDADAAVRDGLVEELLQRNPFEAPASLVERQIESMIEDLLSRFGPQAEKLRQDAEQMAKMRENMKERADRQVRAILALDTLARQSNVEVSDADVQAKIDEMAERAGQNAQRLRALYAEEAAREEMRSRLRREAVLESLKESAAIEEVEVSGDDVADPPEKS